MHTRRALLYMPATDWRKIEKAAGMMVDSICMDLEDGVALNRKEEARVSAVKALNTLDFGSSEKLVRINPVGSGFASDDLATIIPAKPDGIVIPKVSNADEVRWVSKNIRKLEKGSQKGRTRLLAIVETARGIVNLREICESDSRLEALIFGAEDLAGDIGAVRTEEGMEVFYARSKVITYAGAFGLQAIDIVHVNFKDISGLEAECRQGAGMGYVGKQVIHPIQVEPTQNAFTPTDEEIAHARRVVEEFAKHQEEGRGVFSMDGKMVDMPIVRAAERLLARAKGKNK